MLRACQAFFPHGSVGLGVDAVWLALNIVGRLRSLISDHRTLKPPTRTYEIFDEFDRNREKLSSIIGKALVCERPLCKLTGL